MPNEEGTVVVDGRSFLVELISNQEGAVGRSFQLISRQM
jgi:hypothetical protein